MGFLVPLFSNNVFDLSLLKVLTPSQLKCSLCMCSWCFSWALSVPRESLDPHPGGVSISLLPPTLAQLSSHPKTEAGGVSVQGTAFPGAMCHGKRGDWPFSCSCSVWGMGDCLQGKPGMASCHPVARASQWFGMAAWEPWVKQEATGLFYKPLGKSQYIHK